MGAPYPKPHIHRIASERRRLMADYVKTETGGAIAGLRLDQV
ncbi:MAG: hypothetical protein ACXU82_02240 [Caulobacteraceae bacterium]